MSESVNSTVFSRDGVTIYLGDCRTILASLEPQSVHCCVTSPPYWGLRDYGNEPLVWGGDDECEHDWTTHVRAGYRKGQGYENASAWNGREGPRKDIPGDGNRVIETNVCNICGAWHGSFGLEPTPEMFIDHAVEIFRAVKRVLRDDGTLWLNIGDSYARMHRMQEDNVPQSKNQQVQPPRMNGRVKNAGLKPKDLVGIPWMLAFALRADGWYLRQDIIWHKPNPMPESVKDRCTKAHEYIFLLSKSAKYHYDTDAIAETLAAAPHAPGNKKLDASRNDHDQMEKIWGASGKRNRRSVWTVPTRPYSGAHFAVFPPDLIEPCILAGCPEGGAVLDPFLGSGTTADVAIKNGCKCIGCELSKEYFDLAKERFDQRRLW